jgi:hypothetical protein
MLIAGSLIIIITITVTTITVMVRVTATFAFRGGRDCFRRKLAAARVALSLRLRVISRGLSCGKHHTPLRAQGTGQGGSFDCHGCHPFWPLLKTHAAAFTTIFENIAPATCSGLLW